MSKELDRLELIAETLEAKADNYQDNAYAAIADARAAWDEFYNLQSEEEDV